LSVKLIDVARAYRLGKRQPEIDRTRSAILSAARQVVAELGAGSSMAKVAERAGVSRITVYNQFGSRARLLEALAARPGPGPQGPDSVGSGLDPSGELRRRVEQACAAWAADPALYRQLNGLRREQDDQLDENRALVERLAAHDRLRPGCSIKEAEDVIGILTSFPAFDRLHKSGRRSRSAVAEILLGMASGFMRDPEV
jgi:Bacterial regulatory proteins, tetR family